MQELLDRIELTIKDFNDEVKDLCDQLVKKQKERQHLMDMLVNDDLGDLGLANTTSDSCIIGFLYLNSEAYSTSTGILAKSSNKYSPINPACHDVPHAVM